MTVFSSRRIGTKETLWQYYIEDKEDWKRFQNALVIEIKGKKLPTLFKDKKGNKIIDKKIRNKTKVKLLSNETFRINDVDSAYVSIAGTKGYIAISKFGKPVIDTLQIEKIALSKLDAEIKKRTLNKKEGICILIKNERGNIQHVFKNCKSAKNVRGKPKTDFTINSTKPLIFISHKKGGDARSFQQYVSITDNKQRDIINDHPFVQKTLKKFASVAESIVKKRKRYKVRIPFTTEGKELMMLAIYGPDFGKAFGIDHVHLIGQGTPRLQEVSPGDKPGDVGLAYELTFSNGHSLSGELNHFKQQGFVPILWLRYSAGRKIYVDGVEFIGLRAFISPDAMASGNVTELNAK